ncbi:hypothetical protein [Bacillus sp. KH172YL63]|uniref:hypothetical protein n=1 Tax=Bacillus sp. KH172YL63 TaxID=2709784 RepID=UPI0013E43617|nr:hypothetical protein [Bacillus sp. KH172YL63]BCB04380.1 hypothetical protein KH172YL63_25130 [Bacillus sp. KH172YL63]
MINSKIRGTAIPNPKERRRVTLYAAMAMVLAVVGLIIIANYGDTLRTMDEHAYEGLLKQPGSVSRILFFAAFSLYPVFRLMKWKGLNEWKWRDLSIKEMVKWVGRQLRKWHVPIALMGSAGVLIHGFLAVQRDFHWDFTNISGILSFCILGMLTILGFKRFKRMDGGWHVRLAIVFVFLFMVHASF